VVRFDGPNFPDTQEADSTLEERMIFGKRFFGVTACAVALLGLATTANATITGTGCVVSGVGGQTAPTTLAAFTAACAAAGSVGFTFSPPTDNIAINNPAGGTNTVAGTLLTSGINCVGAGCALPPGTNTNGCPGGTCTSSIYDFHYTIGTGEPSSLNFGTITHDDGITLLIGATNVTPGANGPTSSSPTVVGNQAVSVGESIDLIYDECCGLPAVLTANLPGEANLPSVPEPGSIVLFGTAVLGVVFKVRRRRNLA